MAQTDQGKAYIIGDDAQGITLVFTSPAYVLHIPAADLRNSSLGRNIAKAEPAWDAARVTRYVMAAVAREVLMVTGFTDFDVGKTEEDYYRDPLQRPKLVKIDETTRGMANGASVTEVDFCLALDTSRTRLRSEAKRAQSPLQEVLASVSALIGRGADNAEQFDVNGPEYTVLKPL